MYTKYIGPVWRSDLVVHRTSFPRWARSPLRKCLAWLARARRSDASIRYPGPGAAGSVYEDLSNQQFATLAQLCLLGFVPKVPSVDGILANILSYQVRSGGSSSRAVFRRPNAADVPAPSTADAKDRERGFGYDRRGATRSMTAGAVAALARCKMAAQRGATSWPETRDLPIYDGLAWLVRNGEKDRDPFGAAYRYYYRYSLTVACRSTGVVYLGTRHWFTEHANTLFSQQDRDGTWSARLAEIARDPNVGPRDQINFWQTCFSLLFLERDRNLAKAPPTPLLRLAPHSPPAK